MRQRAARLTATSSPPYRVQLQLFDRTPAAGEEPSCRATPAADSRTKPATALEPALAQKLAPLLDFRLERLVLTNNRSTFLSCAPVANAPASSTGCWSVRVHHVFHDADEATLRSLAAFLNRGSNRIQRRQALATLRAFFAARYEIHEETSPVKAPRLEPRGQSYDLTQVLESVRAQAPFQALAREAFSITWSRRSSLSRFRAKRQRTVQLGSYVESARLIRVHPVLDSPAVPQHVVHSVVFHELLHALVPATKRGARRVLHSPEFRRLERLDPGYEASELWIRRHLFTLLAKQRS